MSQKTPLPEVLRMKGGVTFDPELEGYVPIIHSWDNIGGTGEPQEWRSNRIFRTEAEAMRYYKKKIRPWLKKTLRRVARKHSIEVSQRRLE